MIVFHAIVTALCFAMPYVVAVFLIAMIPSVVVATLLWRMVNIPPDPAMEKARYRKKGKDFPAGEWNRLKGEFELTAHRGSILGLNPKALFDNGWAFSGVTEHGLWLFIDTRPHPYYASRRKTCTCHPS